MSPGGQALWRYAEAVTGVPADALRAFLGEARSAARARPMEAQLVKAATGYSGSITLSLGSAS